MHRIFEEIDKEITGEYNQIYKLELKTLMHSLSPKEKSIIAKYFVDTAWNVGSVSVLSNLQECGILSATQYILSQENKEQNDNVDHIQLVLSDFIETKYELLGNILTNSEFSNNLKLKSYLEECFSRLMRDFELDQNIVKRNYLKEIKSIIIDSVYSNLKLLHINCLLELNEVSIKNAFNDFDNWIKDFLTENSTFYEILKELIVDDIETLKKYLLKPSVQSDFKNWKYFVILLNIGTKFSNEDYSKIIKIHLKDLFKNFVSKMTKQLCLTLLITARVFCSASAENDEKSVQNYTQWYKSTFGEMKYTITTKEFKDVMEMLTKLIELEKCSKFLQVHANTSISPPTHCNEIVLKYKKSCRLKLSSFLEISKQNDNNVDLMESIVIEDDD